jgi:hypothetical protein
VPVKILPEVSGLVWAMALDQSVLLEVLDALAMPTLITATRLAKTVYLAAHPAPDRPSPRLDS